MPPEPVQTIEREICCKTYHTEILNAANWMKVPQQFTVVTENMQPEETVDILYKLTGNNFVEVPPCGDRDYRWIIYVLNVGVLNFQVIFIFKEERKVEFIIFR